MLQLELVRLTDRERDAGPACTANLFALPTWYQYGVCEGSTGFNAWREVAAHQIVSDWVLIRLGDPPTPVPQPPSPTCCSTTSTTG